MTALGAVGATWSSTFVVEGAGVSVTTAYPGVVDTRIRYRGYNAAGGELGKSSLREEAAMPVAECARLIIEGMQGPNPDLPYVIATPKHFAVHSGPEPTRHVADIFASAHDIEDTYLPAFRAAIVEAKAGSVMCAYNSVWGQTACASDLLLKDHLRGDWGFKGYVVSDCDAVTDISIHHKYAPDPAAAVAAAFKAGVDNECNTQTLSDTPGLGARYKEAYERGLLGMNDIDRALVRLFSARFRNGDLPGVRADAPVPVSAINTPEHQALALKAAI